MKIIKVESCLKASKLIFQDGECPCHSQDGYTDVHICTNDETGVRKEALAVKTLFTSCPLEDMPEVQG